MNPFFRVFQIVLNCFFLSIQKEEEKKEAKNAYSRAPCNLICYSFSNGEGTFILFRSTRN